MAKSDQPPSCVTIEASEKNLNVIEETTSTRTRCCIETRREKVLLLLLLVVFAALVAVVVALIVLTTTGKPAWLGNVKDAAFLQTDKTEETTQGMQEFCLSADCVEAASRINSMIDYKVSPCDNLYQFACGKWLKDSIIPSDQASIGTFYSLLDRINVILKNLLEEPNRPTDLPSMKKAKDLFASCMNTDLINRRSDQPLRAILEHEFGGFPIINASWSEEHFDLSHVMRAILRCNQQAIISARVDMDYMNTSMNMLMITQPGFGMSRSYYLRPRKSPFIVAYENYLYGMGSLLGFADVSSARRDVADVVDFEIQLAKISIPSDQLRYTNQYYHPTTLGQIQASYGQIMNWTHFFQTLLSDPHIGITDIDESERVNNYVPAYFDRLVGVLNQTSKRTIANYVMFKFMLSVSKLMGDNYYSLYMDYLKVMSGQTARTPLYKSCVATVNSFVGMPMSKMFVRDYFDEEMKEMLLEMGENLKAAFNELLVELDWMDEDTKKLAKEKNDYIKFVLGYPEELANDTFIEVKYMNTTFKNSTYFENIVDNRIESAYRDWRTLRWHGNSLLSTYSASDIDGDYLVDYNIISLMNGILLPPIFKKTYPKFVNYGVIGFIIGHEITHGFDDQGRQYNKYGAEEQWWTKGALEAFNRRKQCIIDQYGNYTLQILSATYHVHSVDTQGEDIADNGGLKQSFRAYRNWVTKQGREEPRLPGLNFTNNQLYFISQAQLWCQANTEAQSLYLLNYDVHSPTIYRVNGPAQNFPEFSKEFNCPVGSYMNPVDKCSVW